jgi:aldehyde:ferredoxin oxidoreductase
METYGYAGKILRVDLSSGSTSDAPTMDYAEKFVGGRGIAAKIYWDEVPPDVDAFDAENTLIFATGPLAGIPVFSGSRWQVCGKSPATTPQMYSYGNLGGRWGAELKFTGYDAIVVQGISEKPVYLFLHDDSAELRDASALWGRGAIETRDILKSELGSSTRVVAIGQAGENKATMATLLADNDASCSAGLGATMGSKRLKAIVVGGSKRGVKVAQPERLHELIEYYRGLGIAFPVAGMEHLSRWSRDPILEFRTIPGPEMKREPCYGCLSKCARRTYEAADGKKGKFICHSAFFYQPYAERYYEDWTDTPFYATKLCDNYGLDAVDIDLMISWLNGCYQAGILTDESAGIPISRLGSIEFIETLLRRVALRDGLGDALAQGIDKAADTVGCGAKEQLEVAGYLSESGYHPYGPRLYIANALLYAMEPRMPISQVHEVGLILAKWVAGTMGLTCVTSDVVRAVAKRFWGSESAADFTTYDGKALATKSIQDRQYAIECLILCNFLWPLTNLEFTDDHVGDPTLESRILSAVTGKEVSEEGLYGIGERVFNLQRAILVREGHHGRAFDNLPDFFFTVPLNYDQANPQCLVPGKDGEVTSRKGAVVDREQFNRMRDEYYQLRQWDVTTGLQTRANLESLALNDVAQDLEQRGLLAI